MRLVSSAAFEQLLRGLPLYLIMIRCFEGNELRRQILWRRKLLNEDIHDDELDVKKFQLRLMLTYCTQIPTGLTAGAINQSRTFLLGFVRGF
jgi:hypothetical protein